MTVAKLMSFFLVLIPQNQIIIVCSHWNIQAVKVKGQELVGINYIMVFKKKISKTGNQVNSNWKRLILKKVCHPKVAERNAEIEEFTFEFFWKSLFLMFKSRLQKSICKIGVNARLFLANLEYFVAFCFLFSLSAFSLDYWKSI